ncbi:tyrosine-protein phosphatase [Sphingobium estronivorans]|uniref:tyrosine-protein phosphatase n=1 Tax=Sphingobium estronivorans TaxID=1577690 RepID=UPI0013C30145|nr:tyrosine-protein phosphatase [Sphingobium estronivorans]
MMKFSRSAAGCFSRLLLVLALPFEIAAAEAPAALPQPPAQYSYDRALPLDGGQNFRDLGGYPTEDHRHVRWGLLFRSGSLHALTPADFSYLKMLGLRTEVDFRSTQERAAEPTDWPTGQAPQILADDYDFAILGRHMTNLQDMTPDEVQAKMVEMYPVILDQFNGQYRRLFDQLLAGKVPLAFHCSAGRDRTGIAAALVLTALGVPRETVIQDYLLTNRYFQMAQVGPAAQTWGKLPPAMTKVMVSSARPSIEAVFKLIDGYPGGAKAYLRDRLGLDQLKIARLRALYTE